MKTRKMLSFVLLLAILVTAFVPLNAFAETPSKTYSISGYVSVRGDVPVWTTSDDLKIPEQLWEEFFDGLKAGVKVEILGTNLYANTDSNGYFVINQVPENLDGYTLRLSKNYLISKEINIETFNSNIKVSTESSPTMMEIDWDVNKDGTINLTDIMYFASLINKQVDSCKISGYITIDPKLALTPSVSGELSTVVELPSKITDILRAGVKVEIEGTNLSSFTDENGYFVIDSVPKKETGYVVNLSRQYLKSSKIVIESLTKDVEVSTKDSPKTMSVIGDINNDGIVNMSDVLEFSRLTNGKVENRYKISGYIGIASYWTYGEIGSSKTIETPSSFSDSVKCGVKVEVDGTGLSALSDKNGYFEIANVPEKETGYVLKLSREYLTTQSVTVQSLTKDTAVSSQNSPIVMKISGDLNNDGASNLSDLMIMAQYMNKLSYKVSGYINPDFDYAKEAESILKAGFKVEVVGRNISAVTDGNGYFELKLLPDTVSIDTRDSGYTLKISKANYLYKEIKIDTLTGDIKLSTPGSPINMEIGDFNGDNAINITDIMQLVSTFNSRTGEEKYIEDYDINKDGAVNIMDILIVAKNYCKTAPVV